MTEFTQFTEEYGADQTFYLIDKLFDILVHKINDYQGVVNELRGDGILAFYGAPLRWRMLPSVPSDQPWPFKKKWQN